MSNKNIFRRIFNRFFAILAQYIPGCTTIRPLIHRLRGVKIHGSVFIGDQVYLENEYPECIEINDEAQIGLRTIIMAHFRGPGKVIIGKKVWIGPNCVITANVGTTITIGEGAMIGASSVITKDVPPYTLMLGAKTIPVAKLSTPMTINTPYHEFKKGLKPLNN